MLNTADRRLQLVPTLVTRIRMLWTGAMPLTRAFWDYAIIGGFILNMTATMVSLALVAANAPVALPLLVHCLPIPYNGLMLVAVWRSARSYAAAAPENRLWASLARVTIVPWILAATLL